MRRKDREITDIKIIEEILVKCKVCHLAMVDEGMPYVIPLSFGYEIKENSLILYFHSAKSGRKIDVLHKNNKVCFEMCCQGEVVYIPEKPCNSGCDFSSVHGFGYGEFITEAEDKCKALEILMKHQVNESVLFTPEQAESVCVFKVVSTNFIGKRKS